MRYGKCGVVVVFVVVEEGSRSWEGRESGRRRASNDASHWLKEPNK